MLIYKWLSGLFPNLAAGLAAVLALAPVLPAHATHQRSAEITYKYISELTYEVTIISYTFTPSPADRPELQLNWGDGTSSIIKRVQKINYPNNISRNVYTYNGPGTAGRHTFPGPGSYILSMEDPNRNYGIVNIPNSVNIPMYVQSELVINPFLGPNSSPVLLNPPIDNGCVGELFVHNPGAYDTDGDSLSYQLVDCRGAGGVPIAGYTLPAASNSVSINSQTGDFLWNTPVMQGEYNIAILITEWRHGFKVGTVTRDMQILIAACNNHPPVIGAITDTCVEAGDTLRFVVKVTDQDVNDTITLTATGGPLAMTSQPALFLQPVVGLQPVSGVFYWITACEHVQKYPYQVFFKAVDNGVPVNLVDYHTVDITVVGPAPENLAAVPLGNTMHLSWNQSPCPNASGYRIYRRNGYFGFHPDHCETGVPAYTGYVLIGETSSLTDTIFIDSNNGTGLIHGIDYCYMVTAIYPDGAESYASLETCAFLKKDLPVITNVSIRHTDDVRGSVFVAWSKPTELDTNQTPGPFKYLIYRSSGITGASLVMIDSLISLNDTTYVDTLLNTKDFGCSYRISFINDTPGNRFLVGTTQTAGSVFIEITPTDEEIILSWALNVPWTNLRYVVYRKNDMTQQFDSIGYTLTTSFHDTGLVNGQNYCYLVRSMGRYSAPDLVDPIVNFSQENCGRPLDNVPPCPPSLSVAIDCDLTRNILTFSNPNHSCAGDVCKYYIYYSPVNGGDLLLTDSLMHAEDTVYIHTGIASVAGCYAVTALDTLRNQSLFSNIVCVDADSCPKYRLPNVFTPNNDGVNDVLRPFPYTSVQRIDMQLFNRWGRMVFTTNNPDILWDGRDQYSKKDCADGVYYYVCDVYEIRLEGIRKRTLSGAIHLLRN